jgi:superfamily II DNA or RNA helicase
MVVEPGFLMSYQREGLARALTWPNESGLAVWSAGSGKTLLGILWALSAGPAVSIVVTKAAIRPSWDRQIREYTRGVELRSLIGESPDPAALAGLDPARPHIFITGYDTLPAWIGALERLRPARVVFDEIHRAKSHQRWDAEQSWEDEGKVKFSLKENQAAACLRLSKVARHRLGLTATPIRDRVRDLWAQLDLVRPGDFGGFWPFAKRYCAARENPFGGMDTRGSSNLAELQRRLGFVVHSVPHSLANRSLPPARRLVTFIPIAQQVRAEGSRNLIRGALKRGAAGLREALLMEAASRKRKIILDHVLDAIDGKLKIVIFTGRKIDVESIRAAISKKALGCPLWAATGEDTPEQREVWRAEFMASPGPAVLVATGESFGEGLDLQDCDLGIMAMLPYTPGQVIQYEGRWVRLGMKRPVEIRYFVAEGTIDEHVSAILLEKLPAIERTVDLDEVRGLTSELAGDESELIASMAAKVLAG